MHNSVLVHCAALNILLQSDPFGGTFVSLFWMSYGCRVEHLSSPHKTSMDVLKEEPTSPRNTFAPEAEQAFDFDFTVLINIESGHCTFYCGPDKDKKKSIQRASSGDISFGGSSPARRGSDFARRSNLTPCCTLYIPGIQIASWHQEKFCVTHLYNLFLVSGVNLEMQYESDGSASALRNTRGSDSKSAAASSRITQRQSMVNGGTPVDSDGKTGRINSAMPRKKGNLFATFSLESLPAETVLTPQLLDFIEQALEPIPVIQQSMVKIPQTIVSEDSETELPTAATGIYLVFPRLHGFSVPETTLRYCDSKLCIMVNSLHFARKSCEVVVLWLLNIAKLPTLTRLHRERHRNRALHASSFE